MASSNEKLCMAVINNSTVTKIDWDGVAHELGVPTPDAANHRWRRFKKSKFGDDLHAVRAVASPSKVIKTKASSHSPTKRVTFTMGDEIGRKMPPRKAKGKIVKYETPSDDEDDEDDSGWDSVKEEEKEIEVEAEVEGGDGDGDGDGDENEMDVEEREEV